MKNPFTSSQFSNSFAKLPDDFYSLVSPTPFESGAQLIHFNTAAAKLLELDQASHDEQVLADIFSGKAMPDNCRPLAMLYAGHQFGHYVPQLGE